MSEPPRPLVITAWRRLTVASYLARVRAYYGLSAGELVLSSERV